MGLTKQEVEKAISEGKINKIPDKTSKTALQIVKENILTYFNLIFLVLSILLISAKAYRSLTILFVVIFNTLIGIFQQLRAKKILDNLSVLDKFKVKTYRDNALVDVPSDELVLGDEVIFSSGDQICADAVVLSGRITVNESLLTGESDEIEKNEADRLLSGSFVVTGTCTAKLTRVGADSYVSRLTNEAKKMQKKEQSEMVKSINRFVVFAGIAIIPIGIALFIQGIRHGSTYYANVTSMVAAVVGMIPEGLYLLVSMTLAVSAGNLALKKVMLHDMRSIESLSRVDVLCVDKTGTITENDMKVKEIVFPKKYTDEEKKKKESLLGAYIGIMVSDNNSTMKALRNRFKSSKKTMNVTDIEPFTSARKHSSVTIEGHRYYLGAPDILLGNSYENYKELIESHTACLERMIAFVRNDKGLEDSTGTDLIMFIVIDNPIRENAVSTFEYFKRQGVDIKVISGDSPATVSGIAQNAGIPDSDKVIDARELKNQEDIRDAVLKYTVFARVSPGQKRDIVRALQKQGHTVAMTGDGVNDIMAMKVADCSITMSCGTEAAVQAAQVVLMDSDFSHMPQIDAEGRKVVGNIERSATLFLCKNIFSLLLAIFSIISVMAYPIKPEHVSLISMFTIGIPAFLLALEPNEHRIKKHFVSRVILKAMPAALTDFLLIAALMMFGAVFNVSGEDVSVAATLLLAIVGFMILGNISLPINKYRGWVIFGCIAGFLITVLFFNDLYSITGISLECGLLFSLFAIASEPFMRYLTRLSVFVEKVIH